MAKKTSDIRVMQIITDLDIGGAEIMLTRILPMVRRLGIDAEVVCLAGSGALDERLKADGFRVTHLNMKPGRPSFSAFFNLLQAIRRFKPTLIHSWLYHADLMASFAAMFCRVPVIWSIHNSEFRPDVKISTRLVVELLATMSSRVPAEILSCSRTASALHVQRGYRADRIHYLPNGFDTDLFAPDDAARVSVRAKYDINDETILIGNVARFDPQKNHRGLIQAFAAAAKEHADVKLLLAGREMTAENDELIGWIHEAEIDDRVILVGEQRDIPAILNAMDIFVLSSISEAFPLTLGEAMSCGRYCITTDVGDSAEIVRYAGEIVRNADELSAAILKGIELGAEERRAIGNAARLRIQNYFSMERMCEGLIEAYTRVANKKG